MSLRLRTRRALGALAAALLLALPGTAGAQDDTVLFATAQVAPNVLVLMDNSGSMNHLVWHPAFDPTQTYGCTYYLPSEVIISPANNDFQLTRCGRTRTIPVDSKRDDDMRYDGAYLNWYFSAAADPYISEILDGTNGFPSSCVGGSAFGKYRRTRMNVAKQVLKDVVCQVNLVGQVRFGIATFRDASDPNGGYVLEEVEIPTSNQQADLISAIQSLSADTWTPLAESLFQLYTYFMSRSPADIPVGVDGSTKFPVYQYNASKAGVGGQFVTNTNNVPVDPVQYSCQKNFIIIVTDGEPTKDDFDVESPTDTARGFADFHKLIGDYHADGEAEGACGGSECSLYLDDVALFMQENDFRPDFAGDQSIDTYTIAFSTDTTATALLQKTAQVGNGLFFGTNDESELAQAIIDSLTDIIEKSQSFTAATVPASRTSSGSHLYVSLFTPSSKTQYWPGHLRSYTLTGAGEIHDKNGQCAVIDPNAPECFSGPFQPVDVRPPFWDAADEVPSPNSRELMVSAPGFGSPAVRFLHADMNTPGQLTAADLGVTTFPPTLPYYGSTATTAEELAAEIAANVRGCQFGTGVKGVACVERPTLLSDIFHSNPVVVGQPALYDPDPSYQQFAQNHATRDRVIYAGSNGGFLHGFLAGTWRTTPAPARYDAGTGEELFGFMPWPARKNIAELPRDVGNRDYYFVDGSPRVSDAWLYTNPTVGTKQPSGSEWATVLVGGMRQGGEAYYALDVTDPSLCANATDAGWPCYMWEFPVENDTRTFALDGTLWSDYVGQTWGDPVIARIRVKVGTNVGTTGRGFERWVAIVTGGYHPSSDPNEHAAYDPNGTEGRSIWILDLKTGEPLAVKRFQDTGRCGTSGEPSYDPGRPEESLCFAFASSPAVYDVDGDGFVDTIVVGDLGGQLWKWVIRDLGEDRVNDGTGAIENQASTWTFRKILQAPVYTSGGVSFYKSFFFPPAATLKGSKVWLAVGTGERADLLYTGDSGTTADNNRFYAFVMPDPFDLQVTLADLQADPEYGVIRENGTDLYNATGDTTCADISAYQGYYFLGAEGEKWVTNIEVFAYIVLVSSYIPTPTTDPCEISGKAFLYAFRIYCGEGVFTDGSGNPQREQDIGAGLPTDPRITIGAGGERVIVSKQGGEIESPDVPFPADDHIGIFYWRELEQ